MQPSAFQRSQEPWVDPSREAGLGVQGGGSAGRRGWWSRTGSERSGLNLTLQFRHPAQVLCPPRALVPRVRSGKGGWGRAALPRTSPSLPVRVVVSLTCAHVREVLSFCRHIQEARQQEHVLRAGTGGGRALVSPSAPGDGGRRGPAGCGHLGVPAGVQASPQRSGPPITFHLHLLGSVPTEPCPRPWTGLTPARFNTTPGENGLSPQTHPVPAQP